MVRIIEKYPNYTISDKGEIVNINTNKELKPYIRNDGYVIISLSKGGKKYKCYLHRLVAETFIPNPDNLPQVNHKDENKSNNCVSNLEWITPKDNCNYGTRNERQGLGHSKPIEQYDLEGNFIKEWNSAAQVERDLGFNHSNISKCCLGQQKTAYNYKWRYKQWILVK